MLFHASTDHIEDIFFKITFLQKLSLTLGKIKPY